MSKLSTFQKELMDAAEYIRICDAEYLQNLVEQYKSTSSFWHKKYTEHLTPKIGGVQEEKS